MQLTFDDCRRWQNDIPKRSAIRELFERDVDRKRNICCEILKSMTEHEAQFFRTPDFSR